VRRRRSMMGQVGWPFLEIHVQSWGRLLPLCLSASLLAAPLTANPFTLFCVFEQWELRTRAACSG
jgi:hypothetical protein